jgi:hypothetical protein
LLKAEIFPEKNKNKKYLNGCQLTAFLEIFTKFLSALRHDIAQILAPKFSFLIL